MDNQLKVSISQHSDKGRKEINQDFHDIALPKEPQLSIKGIAIALADGISSSHVSQIASKVSVTSFLMDFFSTPESWSVRKSVDRVVTATNAWLNAKSRQDLLHLDKDRGYVCTFSALVLRSNTAHVFHIGNTRIYHLRANTLNLLTEDHRLWVSPEKSYLSRALGMDSKLSMEYKSISLEQGDTFLLATDGVYEFLSDKAIIETIENEKFEDIAKALIELAFSNGSDDNLTAQLVRVDTLAHKDVDEIHRQLTEKPCPPILETRSEFEGYEIVRELSANSRSHVYLARDKVSQEQVVLKIPSIDLQNDKAYLERFLMEEWVARRVTSTHLMKAYEQTRQRNYLYNVFEFIKGQTLNQWMIDHPKLSLETVRDITDQIAKGLFALHKREMIHQDLRPQNILIDSTETVKIIDFGATKITGIADVNTFLDQENLLGTALYSAPEYFLGYEGTYQSDIYSLGAIVYQMLSDELPYGVLVARSTTRSAQNKLKYHSIYHEENSIPLWVDEALRKALQVDPNKRYSELSEFIYDLKHPNRNFLNKNKPPFIERNPIQFWQMTTLIMMIINIVLLTR